MACASSCYECPVCHEDYVVSKILPCGHLVCQKCVLSWVEKEGRRATCPLCRSAILSPSPALQDPAAEVSALPTDLYTAALVESQQVLRGPHVCSLCENDTAATAYCVQCAFKLCSGCGKGHKKIPTTKSHFLENLDELSAAKLAETRQVTCKAHPDRPGELYCPAHQEVICILCGTTSHGSCADRKTVADMLGETQAELDLRVSKLEEKEGELAQQVQNAKDHLKAARKKVGDTFDDIQKILDSQRQKFDWDIQAEEESLATSLSAVEKTRAALTQNARSLGHLVKSASGGALLQMLKALRSRLDDLERQAEEGSMSTRDANHADFIVDTGKLSCLKEDLTALGYVGKPEDESEQETRTVLEAYPYFSSEDCQEELLQIGEQSSEDCQEELLPIGEQSSEDFEEESSEDCQEELLQIGEQSSEDFEEESSEDFEEELQQVREQMMPQHRGVSAHMKLQQVREQMMPQHRGVSAHMKMQQVREQRRAEVRRAEAMQQVREQRRAEARKAEAMMLHNRKVIESMNRTRRQPPPPGPAQITRRYPPHPGPAQ